MTFTSNPFRIRRMTAVDLDQVIEIAASLEHAPNWVRGAYVTALDPEASRVRIALTAADPTTGAVAGFAVVSLTPPEAELETIAVAGRFQRRGAARQLFDEAIKALRQAEMTEISLEVRGSNRPALAFYGSLGFVETGRRPCYYAEPVEDAILMRLSLV